jgi:uncharacterized protein DUF932
VTGEPAWHRLGTVVQQAQTSTEAIQLAGLDWTVNKRNIAAALPDGAWQPVDGQYAMIRSDTNAALGVVGEWYRPFQNADAFALMDNIVGEKLALFETAGSLKGGKRVWMMARLPREVRAAGEDVIHPYVLLTNTHDGWLSCERKSAGGFARPRRVPYPVKLACNPKERTMSSVTEATEVVQAADLGPVEWPSGRGWDVGPYGVRKLAAGLQVTHCTEGGVQWKELSERTDPAEAVRDVLSRR